MSWPVRLCIRTALGTALIPIACSYSSTTPHATKLSEAEARGLDVASSSITSQEMMRHITVLASDELAGRDTPSPGLEAAATYLAESFAAAGLSPAGDTASFLQRWQYLETLLKPAETKFAYEAIAGRVELAYASDCFVLPGVATSVRGQLVFLGGVQQLIDQIPTLAAGRTAVVTVPTNVGLGFFSAIRNAAAGGAVALIGVMEPSFSSELISMVADQVTDIGAADQPIPAVGVTWNAGSDMLSASGADLDFLATASDEGPTSPLRLDLVVEIDVTQDKKESNVPNVVGVLRGSHPELANTYIVVSAQFDHLGIDEADASGDSIYNGADDNASGMSALLEIAEAFRAMPRPPARSVIFLAVSGEEKGLLGSAHFAEHPTVPGESLVANINLDMLGRNAPDTVIVVGLEYSSLGPLAQSTAAAHPNLGLTVVQDPDPSDINILASDHAQFLKKDVPSIFLFTGEHEDVHKPSDEASKINPDKAARVARLAFLVAWAIANDPTTDLE